MTPWMPCSKKKENRLSPTRPPKKLYYDIVHITMYTSCANSKNDVDGEVLYVLSDASMSVLTNRLCQRRSAFSLSSARPK